MPAKKSAAKSATKSKKASPKKKGHSLEQDLQDLLKSPEKSLREAVEKSTEFLRKAAQDARKAIDKQANRAARNKSSASSDPVAASALLLKQATEYLNEAMESVSREINSRLEGKPSKKPASRKK